MLPELVRATASMEEDHWWFAARREIVKSILGHCLPPDPDSVVLDVGCGGGANVAGIADTYRCVGIDPSRTMIAAAREKYPDVEFVCGTVPNALPESASSADACLLMDVLEHVDNDRSLLADVLGVCRPGGAVIVTVPANPSLWGPHDEAHGHHRRYTRESLSKLFEGCPVRVELLSYFNARLYPLVWTIRHIEKRLGGGPGTGSSDLLLLPEWLNGLLRRVLSREGRVLVDCLAGRREIGFRRGSSLIAVITRKEASEGLTS